MKDFYDVLQIVSLEEAVSEAEKIFAQIFPTAGFDAVRLAVETVLDLYEGRYPGYRACNTYYHDFCHIRDTFLATARLIHGAWLDDEVFSEQAICVALTAALFHDAGYIQENFNSEGTGAKFTKIHIPRSMDMFERYGREHAMSDEDIAGGRAMIQCTDISKDIDNSMFSSSESELLGRILTMADLLAQMADRIYLEKLLFLYHEFDEGEFGSYDDEDDLLRKTLGFFEFVMEYMSRTLNKTNDYLWLHFKCRWGIDINLYDRAIKNHKDYLQKILALPDKKLSDNLKRAGIVDKVRVLYPQKPKNSDTDLPGDTDDRR